MMFDSVPKAMAELPQWVYWHGEITAAGRPTKIPYQIKNWIRLAASTRPDEWATLDLAKLNFGVSGRSGLGFVFVRGGGIFGIDVDAIEKVAPEDRDAALRLRRMIYDHFPTYCEVSPSGEGRHYIGFGSLPAGIGAIKDSKYGIEIYDQERFFTFTGQVIAGRADLVDCQDALNDLAATMRQASAAVARRTENSTDQRDLTTIYQAIASWSNGDEFVRLMRDPLPVTLGRYKQDHSGADMALANFIATGTKDHDKAVEMFRHSPLWRDGGKGGYRPESKYIADYIIARCLGKVWGENSVKAENQKRLAAEGAQIAGVIAASEDAKKGTGKRPPDPTSYARAFGINLPLLDTSRTDVPFPPGMAGKFVQAIYDACPTPVEEFVIAASMAFLSGVVGRAYRFNGVGLNTFFMIGAKSATGKTQSVNALQRLLSRLDNPLIAERVYAVSGKTVQGMHPHFEKAPAGAWITDECGAQVQALVNPSSQSDHELKDSINALYDSATPGKKWRPPVSMRSHKEDKAVSCLSVGIAWYTTREKIYAALNDNEIADGFLSRFIPIFYNGVMGEDNPNVIDDFPPEVKQILNTLWSVIQENDVHMPIDGVANSSKSVKVGITADAAIALHDFSSAARNITRRAQSEHDDLPDAFIAMSRVGISAQRLAGVCAVMDNPIAPVMTVEHVAWAVQLVGSRMLHVLELMATGEVGSGDRIEVPTIVRVMRRLIHQHGARVPMSAMHDKLRLVLPFKEARIGPMNAVKQALNNMVDEGRLARLIDVDGTAGRPGTFYTVTKDEIWKSS